MNKEQRLLELYSPSRHFFNYCVWTENKKMAILFRVKEVKKYRPSPIEKLAYALKKS